MAPKIWINGKLYDKGDAKISVYDHGLLYGDGVFEGIRVYGGKVFRLSEHIDRLYDSARAIYLEIPLSRQQMIDAVEATVRANSKKEGYIRLVITRGAGSLGLDPRKTSDPQVIIIVDDIVMYPPELYENGMEIVTAATIRNHPNAVNPRIKSLNYLNNIMAKMEGDPLRLSRSADAEHQGRIGRMHRRQYVSRQAWRAEDAAAGRRYPGRHHAQRRDRSGSRSRHPGAGDRR